VGGRFLVFLEGDRLLKVTEEEVLRFALYSGQELDEPTLADLTRSAGRSNARATAGHMIGARPLSKGELIHRLIQKGIAADWAQDAADWLENIGALDDKAYAEMLARHYAARGYGPRRIQNEFYKRRVPSIYWPQALEQLKAPDETIDRLIVKKLGGKTPDRKELSRVSAFLARRGFDWNDIREGLARYGAGLEEI
jgi:regulatory protein